jgi:hypothetical protein
MVIWRRRLSRFCDEGRPAPRPDHSLLDLEIRLAATRLRRF